LDLAAQRAVQTETPWHNTEFPRYDPRRTGEKTELTVMLTRSKTMNAVVSGMDTVLTLRQPIAGDAGAIQAQQYHYGNDWIAEEHQYIPHPTRAEESAGWIVGSAYHWPSEKTSIAVFEANALSKGPVAVLRLPYGLPLGLHGQFVAA
jgi:all-trans-8'-apo-beta-carotenal 15,15'-oxygenase